ncbi:hypothetical protein KXW44_005069 [Aspergillus fumigatus]|nr:hypothetical protein KXW47_004581 [Aspergillus fumigatus]KAH2805286.1 hypothetical protein KXV23_000365 [Aspergillus fumigatus]KAH2949305.1 hypothetical protein KXW00_004844 [Aspergillus fumigatus]KAH3181275.1 hypothetical protein KXX02_004079 [Aspergillus fumigatus]KAH3313651.1 hypothetical protein KXW17_005169 [Aspergillus fumigatus]
MARSSNEKRAQRRQQCREALANHIYDRLGLRIQPQAVRLQPAPEDGYTWSVTDSKAHLMKTSLSSGTVGLYDAICKEIGRSIEAVRPSREADEVLDSDLSPDFGEGDSFTAIIERLKRENGQLREEIGQLRDQIEKISRASQGWEMKNMQLERDIIRERSLIHELTEELSNVRSGVGKAVRLLLQHRDCQVNHEEGRLAVGPTSSLVLLPPASPSALELHDRIAEWMSATLIWMQPVCEAAVSGALWQVSEVLTEATLLAGCRQRQIVVVAQSDP